MDAALRHLERARDTPRLDEMLALLLDAWRERPSRELAEMIDLVSRRAAVAEPPRSAPASLESAQRDWLAVAERARAVDLPWLVDHLVASRRELSLARARRLAAWPADPRLSPLLLRLAEQKPMSSQPARPFWTIVFRILHDRADPRAAPIVGTLLETKRVTEFDAYLALKLASLRSTLEAAPPLPAALAQDRVVLDGIAQRLDVAREAKDHRTAEELLAAVWRDPADDGARAVFADWLLERGDVRGELIALQLASSHGRRDPAALRREKALLAQHARAWMGPIEPAVHSTAFRFERGFLFACKVAWRKLAASPLLMTHPAWATVREYELDPAGEAACDPWLDHMVALGARRR